jgi:hypothetical protein
VHLIVTRPYIIPFIQAQANNVTFQQDNAISRVVRDYLTQQNVDVQQPYKKYFKIYATKVAKI